MLTAPTNVNGRPNSDVVRPVASAVDLVQHSRRKWTIDFNMMPFEEAVLYEMPFQYVQDNIYPLRQNGRRDDFQGQWWRYARPRPEMRQALGGLGRFITSPAVAKHRVFVWMPPEVLCNQGTLVFTREDDYFFGVLHSRFHEVWALRLGTYLGVGNDPRYTPTTTFETFPFPWPPGHEPAEADSPTVRAIADAARRLVTLRDNWLNPPDAAPDELKKRTLTNLYNARPAWLTNAHATLDAAVAAAYQETTGDLAWTAALPDEEILARLLALNRERAGT